jgi:rhamnose utilization protein RhaD (predicted bifunctional aldolase and dehydrogenase)/NAD(P)-dependent dehydrogenase (short-subunit alcohol dehydrogenase family)
MRSLWQDQDAEDFVQRYGAKGINRDLALRVYTSRLLGQDPRLVLHGGGNTSVKTTISDFLGDAVEVLCVKGSGWDLGNIEPAGLPAVRLAPMLRLRDRDQLTDEEMVAFQRAHMLDQSGPNPSVETLFHAFLPHKFVDHTHSTAILSLTDQLNGAEICAEVFGDRVAILPYVMPGFGLAKAAADAYDQNPKVEGLLLGKHGLFSFGENARQSYERMIALVSLAEVRIAKGRRPVFVPAPYEGPAESLEAVAPILRGAVGIAKANGDVSRLILDFRTNEAIRHYVDGADLARYSQAGCATPDHTIRTKNWPLIAPFPKADDLSGFKAQVTTAVHAFTQRYQAYFAAHDPQFPGERKMLDPMPRVILVPGLGLFGLGADKTAAAIAADIAENTIQTITDAESIGRFEALGDKDLFEMEYWSLEQAKLGKAAERPLARQVAVITGGAGAIGLAVAQTFAKAGAEIALIDRDPKVADIARAISKTAIGLVCDVTDPSAVGEAFDAVVRQFGGVDILVSNAGAAWQGRIGHVPMETLRQSFELNFFSHQIAAQKAVAIMEAQATGGCLLFNVSKQAVNPGPDFGPYGLPKAALLFLSRQYALDHAASGIRSNAVNADRVRSGLLTDDMIAQRSAARGLSEADYMGGNLLKREVTAQDVAEAFLAQALALKTTGSVTTVDGGNIAAALR